jgi:hypothetical protein
LDLQTALELREGNLLHDGDLNAHLDAFLKLEIIVGPPSVVQEFLHGAFKGFEQTLLRTLKLGGEDGNVAIELLSLQENKGKQKTYSGDE